MIKYKKKSSTANVHTGLWHKPLINITTVNFHVSISRTFRNANDSRGPKSKKSTEATHKPHNRQQNKRSKRANSTKLSTSRFIVGRSCWVVRGGCAPHIARPRPSTRRQQVHDEFTLTVARCDNCCSRRPFVLPSAAHLPSPSPDLHCLRSETFSCLEAVFYIFLWDFSLYLCWE